jgi:hypothetical protein
LNKRLRYYVTNKLDIAGSISAKMTHSKIEPPETLKPRNKPLHHSQHGLVDGTHWGSHRENV